MRFTPSARLWWLLPTLTFTLTRAWLILIPFGVIPYLGGTLVINDVTLYEQWSQILQSGRFPVDDQMWQYPPLVGPVFALGALVPPDPTLGLMLVMLAFDAAAMKDSGKRCTVDAAEAKLFAANHSLQICIDAQQVLGGNGYSKEYHVERFVRDARIFSVAEGTNEILRMIISGSVLAKK